MFPFLSRFFIKYVFFCKQSKIYSWHKSEQLHAAFSWHTGRWIWVKFHTLPVDANKLPLCECICSNWPWSKLMNLMTATADKRTGPLESVMSLGNGNNILLEMSTEQVWKMRLTSLTVPLHQNKENPTAGLSSCFSVSGASQNQSWTGIGIFHCLRNQTRNHRLLYSEVKQLISPSKKLFFCIPIAWQLFRRTKRPQILAVVRYKKSNWPLLPNGLRGWKAAFLKITACVVWPINLLCICGTTSVELTSSCNKSSQRDSSSCNRILQIEMLGLY